MNMNLSFRLQYLAAGAALIASGVIAFSPAPPASADSGCTEKNSSVLLGWHRDPFANDQTDAKQPNWSGNNKQAGITFKDYDKIGKGDSGNCVSYAKQLMVSNHCKGDHQYGGANIKKFDEGFEADIRALQKLGQQYVLFKNPDGSIQTPFVDGIIGPQTWALMQANYNANSPARVKLIDCNGK